MPILKVALASLLLTFLLLSSLLVSPSLCINYIEKEYNNMQYLNLFRYNVKVVVETEKDGTWISGEYYVITVSVKLTYINKDHVHWVIFNETSVEYIGEVFSANESIGKFYSEGELGCAYIVIKARSVEEKWRDIIDLKFGIFYETYENRIFLAQRFDTTIDPLYIEIVNPKVFNRDVLYLESISNSLASIEELLYVIIGLICVSVIIFLALALYILKEIRRPKQVKLRSK